MAKPKAKTKKPSVMPRRPPGREAAAFVSGTSDAPPGYGLRGGLTTRRTVKTGDYAGQVEVRTTVAAPEDLLLKARVWCAKNRTSLSANFVEALRSRVGAY